MKILVSGGAGYIGAHTALELVAAGHEPVLLDNFSNASPGALSALTALVGQPLRLVEGDIRDGAVLDRVFERDAFAAVIHLAALKAVGESVAQPLRYYSNNVAGSARLLECMASHGVRSLVFSSTATVFAPAEAPLTEDAPTAPASPYARSKLIVEDVLRDLHGADGRWGISILRYFNAGGAHGSGRIGESPLGTPQNLLPRVAEAAGGRGRLEVFGDDWPTPDGTCMRDYVHVVDLARAHVLAVERAAAEPGVATYNLGTGRGHSVLEVVRAFERVNGVAVPRRITARRPGDVAVLCADPSRARRELGWRAVHDLDRICADLWRWWRSHPDGFGTGA